MPNLGAVLKTEIARLARKEVRAYATPLIKTNARLRGEVAGLKKQVQDLQKQVREASRASARRPAQAPASTADAPNPRMRITPAGIKTLRGKLGLSAEALGRLVGATGQSVYSWESENGSRPSGARLQALMELRLIGKREAQRRLEALT